MLFKQTMVQFFIFKKELMEWIVLNYLIKLLSIRSSGRREPVIRRYAQHPVLVRRRHGSGGRTPAY